MWAIVFVGWRCKLNLVARRKSSFHNEASLSEPSRQTWYMGVFRSPAKLGPRRMPRCVMTSYDSMSCRVLVSLRPHSPASSTNLHALGVRCSKFELRKFEIGTDLEFRHVCRAGETSDVWLTSVFWEPVSNNLIRSRNWKKPPISGEEGILY